MNRTLVILLLAGLAGGDAATGADDWPRAESPGQAGFSADGLAAAQTYWQEISPPPAAVMVVRGGRSVLEWGDVTGTYRAHSMRKSFLSALYGIHITEGTIDTSLTMAELGIDDTPPLTPTEKTATVRDLLMARSGVYLPAASESRQMKADRPLRGSHPPGTFWYYNNWDFNVLGTVFEQETGRGIFDDFDARIARPLGMQDFDPAECCWYQSWGDSPHRSYKFRMSTRDRARFGLLYLQRGEWRGKQIVPAGWVEASTARHSPGRIPGQGYGYLWWTWNPELGEYRESWKELFETRFYYASGVAQRIGVFPEQDLVVVVTYNTDEGDLVHDDYYYEIFDRILAAVR